MLNTIFVISILCLASFAKKPFDFQTVNAQATKFTPKVKAFHEECLLKDDLDFCLNALEENFKIDEEKFIFANIIFDIDRDRSYKIHERLFNEYPDEDNVKLEWAMQLHREGKFKEASDIYQELIVTFPKDFRIKIWLAECYINLEKHEEAITVWKSANHKRNHTGIDFAIHLINGNKEHLKKRDQLIKKVSQKDIKSAYFLIEMSLNWEFDWWNTRINENYLLNDLAFIKKHLSIEVYDELRIYADLKLAEKENLPADSIKNLFKKSKIIENPTAYTNNGKVYSEVFRIGLSNKLIDAKYIYETKGKELTKLADAKNDVEFLNVYAFLQARVKGKVVPELDKLGWEKYKSEKFCRSYFTGLREKNTYDNPHLNKAINDFPHSAYIRWIKVNSGYIEKKDIKADLIELIKLEFKSLDSDYSRYSYKLNAFLMLLESKL
jgi:hypothetical protein